MNIFRTDQLELVLGGRVYTFYAHIEWEGGCDDSLPFTDKVVIVQVTVDVDPGLVQGNDTLPGDHAVTGDELVALLEEHCDAFESRVRDHAQATGECAAEDAGW